MSLVWNVIKDIYLTINNKSPRSLQSAKVQQHPKRNNNNPEVNIKNQNTLCHMTAKKERETKSLQEEQG